MLAARMSDALRELSVLSLDCQASGASPSYGDLIELGWGIERSLWGQGLATEAATEVLALGSRLFGSGRLVAKCHADNGPSERVMDHIGLRRAGPVLYLECPTLIYRAT